MLAGCWWGSLTESTWKTPVYMEGNIKMDLTEIEEEGMDWINLALERHEWCALVNIIIIMNYSYNKSNEMHHFSSLF